jgi:hypothetical protein
MSELNKCNYCTEQAMKQKAKERRVALIYGVTNDGWITVRYGDMEEPSAYFLELTDHCAC